MTYGPSRKGVARDTCSVCGRPSSVTLLNVPRELPSLPKPEGSFWAAQCRPIYGGCGEFLSNLQWREIRAARYGNTPEIRKTLGIEVAAA